jgi:cardiolipin synthase
MGAAITNRRVLGPAEATTLLWLGIALLVFAGVSLIWPLAVAIPLAVLAAWIALSSFARARELRAMRAREARDERVRPRPPDMQ